MKTKSISIITHQNVGPNLKVLSKSDKLGKTKESDKHISEEEKHDKLK